MDVDVIVQLINNIGVPCAMLVYMATRFEKILDRLTNKMDDLIKEVGKRGE